MTRTALLAVAFVAVVGSSSAFSPIVVTTTSSNRATTTTTATTTITTTFLVPEQGRQLVAFSQDYLSKKAKDSAGKASNLRGDRGRSSGSSSDPSSMSSSPQGGGVGPAAKGIVTRLLGHDNTGGWSTRERSLEEELVNNAYPKDPNCHSEEFCNSDDEVLFHQIVD